MTATEQFPGQHGSLPLAVGSRLGLKSAFIGSVVFAVIDIVKVWINPADSTSGANLIWFCFFFVVLVIAGSALSFLPALLSGALLTFILRRNACKKASSRTLFIIKGLAAGGVAGIATCLPILIFQYYFIQPGGHGNFDIFIYRTIVAVVIASVAGGWVSRQLALRLQA